MHRLRCIHGAWRLFSDILPLLSARGSTAGGDLLQYRREIDGLRALAVIPVLAFHGRIDGFAGGFVGVDVFFVISGYLITSIILDGIERDRFSLLGFYERRARRLLPALFAMLIIVTPLSIAVLPPHRLAEYALSAAAAIAFVSNIYFAHELAGYFAPTADLQPLLHTWSLGVEEQFYIVFPVFLLLLHGRLSLQGLAKVVLLAATLSIAGAAYQALNYDRSAFFLAPYRVWELLAGTLCALAFRLWRVPTNSLLGWLGIGLVILAIVQVIPGNAPSVVLAVAGTSLVVLYARDGNSPARLLSLRVLVGIGLISYSLYLWHQPLLALARSVKIGPLTLVETCAVLVSAMAISWLSWRFVEQPFRTHHHETAIRSKPLLGIAGTAFVLMAACITLWTTHGLPQRFDSQAIAAYRQALAPDRDSDRCKIRQQGAHARICTRGAQGAHTARIAIIGDSHASQWAGALDRPAARQGWQLIFLTRAGCPVAEVEKANCARWRDNAFRAVADQPFDLVIVAQSSRTPARALLEGYEEEWFQGLTQLGLRLDRLGKRWAFLSDSPIYRLIDPQECVFKARFLGLTAVENCREPASLALDPRGDEVMRKIVATSIHGHFIDMNEHYCPKAVCVADAGGIPGMRDRGHLSIPATHRLAPALVERIGELLETSNPRN